MDILKGLLVFIVIIGSIWLMIYVIVLSDKYSKKFRKDINKIYDDAPEFNMTKELISYNKQSAIAFDNSSKKLFLIKINNYVPNGRLIDYTDLISSAIFEDGETITSTIRSSQLGGALIGGLALGGVGALIGGLSGKTSSNNKVSKIELRVKINDTVDPNHDVILLGRPLEKKGFGKTMYETYIKEAREWQSIIEVLIKQADIADKAKANTVNIANISNTKSLLSEKSIVNSVADEIQKLIKLRDDGILNETEFQAMKVKLIS